MSARRHTHSGDASVVRATFLATPMDSVARTATDKLRAAAIQVKHFDSMTGASPSLEEIHLPGGWVVGIVTEGHTK